VDREVLSLFLRRVKKPRCGTTYGKTRTCDVLVRAGVSCILVRVCTTYDYGACCSLLVGTRTRGRGSWSKYPYEYLTYRTFWKEDDFLDLGVLFGLVFDVIRSPIIHQPRSFGHRRKHQHIRTADIPAFVESTAAFSACVASVRFLEKRVLTLPRTFPYGFLAKQAANVLVLENHFASKTSRTGPH
jgi:hypothetical protein